MQGIRNRKYSTLLLIYFLVVVWAFSFDTKSYGSDLSHSNLGNKICFDIDEIQINDKQLLHQKIIKAIKNDYESKCLNADDINGLIRKLANLYIENGFITTSPHIPEQNLQSKKLIIEVKKGHIEEIKYKSKRNINQTHILPITEKNTLNLRDLEQSVDQFGTLKSDKTKIEVMPGKEAGSSILLVDDEVAKAFDFNTTFDNYGSKNKGTLQGTASITAKNLFKSNDQFHISLKQSLNNPKIKYARIYSGGFSIPYYYHNLNFNVSHSQYRNFIEANKQIFRNAGISRVHKFSINSVIHRDGISKTFSNFAFGHENYNNYIDDNKIEISSYRIDKFEAGINHQRRLNASVLGFGATYTNGFNKDFKKGIGLEFKPKPRFHKLNYNLFWLKPMKMKPNYFSPKFTTFIQGQFTNQRLVGSEKFSLGGISTIRGYKENIENSDNGILVRNELSLGFVSKEKVSFLEEVEFFNSIDIGRFSNFEEKTISGMMYGYSFGLRNTKGPINFDITIGVPLYAKYIKDKNSVMYFSIGLDL